MTDGESPDNELPGSRHLTYQQQMKYCNRATCTRCRSGTPSHGPYWYASWREGGRVRSRYLGKQTPPGYMAMPESQRTPAAAPIGPRKQPPLRIQTLGRLAVWCGTEPVPEK